MRSSDDGKSGSANKKNGDSGVCIRHHGHHGRCHTQTTTMNIIPSLLLSATPADHEHFDLFSIVIASPLLVFITTPPKLPIPSKAAVCGIRLQASEEIGRLLEDGCRSAATSCRMFGMRATAVSSSSTCLASTTTPHELCY